MNKKSYEKLAEVAVRIGINLRKGQDVVIFISTNQGQFAEILTEKCYTLGAKTVFIEWQNEKILSLGYIHQSVKSLCDVRPWQIKKAKERSILLPCYIYVLDENPDAFKEIDGKKISASRLARYKALKKYWDIEDNNNQWTIIALPSKDWAKKVFPLDKSSTAIKRLSEAIIMTTRLNSDDPIGVWEEHVKSLKEKSDYLNSLNLDYLKYESSNGTNLTVKLHPNHYWLSARETNKLGREFTANLPTEEVFTMPKRDGTNGVVVSTKPLSYNGQLIENFTCYFENGKCVKAIAKKGQVTLDTLLNMDESSRYLGEVALVPFNSPINKTNILFYNTLFDENACCHLAFGEAFKNNIKGYENMNEEDFKSLEVNESANHVDFMIGSEDLSIKGYDLDGKEYIIFKDGNWF